MRGDDTTKVANVMDNFYEKLEEIDVSRACLVRAKSK